MFDLRDERTAARPRLVARAARRTFSAWKERTRPLTSVAPPAGRIPSAMKKTSKLMPQLKRCKTRVTVAGKPVATRWLQKKHTAGATIHSSRNTCSADKTKQLQNGVSMKTPWTRNHSARNGPNESVQSKCVLFHRYNHHNKSTTSNVHKYPVTSVHQTLCICDKNHKILGLKHKSNLSVCHLCTSVCRPPQFFVTFFQRVNVIWQCRHNRQAFKFSARHTNRETVQILT